MGDVINLRLARKARSRDAAAKTAAANRVRFGRSKAERDGDAVARLELDRALDGAKLED